MINSRVIPTEVAYKHFMGEPDMDIYNEFFSRGHAMSRELFALVCGDRLGGGVSRVVYECKMNPTYVLKFEYGNTFQNVMEWEVWSANEKDTSENSKAKWLAPCQSISPCGQILMQRKTIPLRPSELPEKVPRWMCDPKIDNWGLFEGKPVLHDYGYTHLLATHTLNQLKKNHKWEKPE